ITRPPPRPPLFPYTTLFRSLSGEVRWQTAPFAPNQSRGAPCLRVLCARACPERSRRGGIPLQPVPWNSLRAWPVAEFGCAWRHVEEVFWLSRSNCSLILAERQEVCRISPSCNGEIPLANARARASERCSVRSNAICTSRRYDHLACRETA